MFCCWTSSTFHCLFLYFLFFDFFDFFDFFQFLGREESDHDNVISLTYSVPAGLMKSLQETHQVRTFIFSQALSPEEATAKTTSAQFYRSFLYWSHYVIVSPIMLISVLNLKSQYFPYLGCTKIVLYMKFDLYVRQWLLIITR